MSTEVSCHTIQVHFTVSNRNQCSRRSTQTFFGNLRTMRQRHCRQRPFNSNTRPKSASVARPYHRPALRPKHYFTENSTATDCCPCVAIGRHSLPRDDFAFLRKMCFSWRWAAFSAAFAHAAVRNRTKRTSRIIPNLKHFQPFMPHRMQAASSRACA
jgi:hypothetical protein